MDQVSFSKIAEEQYSLLLQWLIEQKLVEESKNNLDMTSLMYFRIFNPPELGQAEESVCDQVKEKLFLINSYIAP